MERFFITVNRNNLSIIVPGTEFSQEDFHGSKNDSRNNVPDAHSIDRALPVILDQVLIWARDTYPNIGIVILSTKRTPSFNEIISTTGSEGSHVLGIATDFAFTGPDAQNAWCDLKEVIVNKTSIFQSLLAGGLGGVGVYGNFDRGRYFFHFDTRQQGDGLSRNQSLGGFRYGLWTRGDLSCDLAKEEGITNDADEVRDRQRALPQEEELNRFIEYTHLDVGDSISLEDLVQDKLFIGKDLTAQELREVVRDNISNNRRLFENLSKIERRGFNGDDDSYNEKIMYPITPGAILYIPFDKIETTANYEGNFTTTKTNFNQFFPPLINRLTTDPGYIPNKNINTASAVKRIYPEAKVFIWSRTRYLENNFSGGFLDITDDIISLDIANSLQGGGDFTIETSGTGISIEESANNDITRIIRSNVTPELTKSNINTLLRDSSNQLGVDSEIIRNISFYRKILFKNDLVFISYEKLDIDGRIEDVIENKWYDMIGLIDSVEESTNAMDLTSINIRGRSLINVLMDDNSYFNPVSIGHMSAIYGGDPFSNGRYLDSSFQELSSILARSVRQNLEFIFYRIATIGYVPDDIFSQFKNRSLVSKYTRNVENGTVEEEAATKGIWQIMKLFIDDNISQLRLADSSISNPEGSILELVMKTCQAPFVEFFTDTYGDKFYLIARKPPFEQQALREALFQISDSIDESFNRFSLNTSNEGETNNRYLEALQFEEDNAETNNTVTSGERIPEQLIGTTGIRSLTFPKIINITEENVISDTLRYSSRGYAWYQLEEQGNFLGSRMGVGVIPALYFDEIAQILGNRRLTVVSNYTSLTFYLDKNTDTNRNAYGEQVAQQLAFMVETNLHLPFTREGTISINPDRRVKVGNYIYYRPTKEIFYVTGVNNTMRVSNESIERQTTITVERGMEALYINDSPEIITTPEGESREINVSYFNLIDIDRLRQQIYDVVSRETVDGKFNYKGAVSINTDVFNFFLQKRQLER